MATTLLGSSEHDIRISRVEQHVIHPRIFTDIQNLFPGLAAIFRAVKPAVAARAPDGAFGCNEYQVGIARVNCDHADLTGFFQSHVFPGFAPVGGFIDPISVAECTLVVIFAGAGPDYVVVSRVHCQASDRIRSILVEDGLERIAVIGSFPDVSAGNSHEIFVMVVGIYGKVGNAARGKSRPDAAQFQAADVACFDGICDDGVFLVIFFIFFFLGQCGC